MFRFYRTNQFDSPSKRMNDQPVESKVQFQRRLAFILWFILTIFGTYCFMISMTIKIYVFCICLFHVVLEIFANGIIDFVCDIDAQYREKKRLN